MAIKNRLYIDNARLSALKNLINSAFGKEIATDSDCRELSVQIKNKTKREIGITTLRRLFKLDISKFQPSRYTLDTLSIFTGYQSWLNYNYKFDLPDAFSGMVNYAKIPLWQNIKKNASDISASTFNYMDCKYENDFSGFFDFDDIFFQTNSFLCSNKSAMAFIAPAGYGKSLALSGLARRMIKENAAITGKEEFSTDDIVCFFDTEFSGLFGSHGSSIESWLCLNLELGDDFSTLKFLASHPEKRFGRLIIIMDALDETCIKKTNPSLLFSSILRLLVLFEGFPWCKMIFAFSDFLWKKFLILIREYPNSRKYWWGVAFSVHSRNFINLPQINEENLVEFFGELSKKYPETDISKLTMVVRSGDFGEYLRIPFFAGEFTRAAFINNEIPVSEVFFAECYHQKKNSIRIIDGRKRSNNREISRNFRLRS